MVLSLTYHSARRGPIRRHEAERGYGCRLGSQAASDTSQVCDVNVGVHATALSLALQTGSSR